MTNAQNIKALNRAIASGDAQCVSHSVLISIGGSSAVFFRMTDGDGFCRVTRIINNRLVETVNRVSKTVIDKADAVEWDPYNTAGMAIAYLKIAGVMSDDSHQPEFE